MQPWLFAFYVTSALSGLTVQKPVWQPSPGHTQIQIWPGTAPDPQPVAGPEYAETSGKDFLPGGRPTVGVSNVTRPTMTVYSPKSPFSCCSGTYLPRSEVIFSRRVYKQRGVSYQQIWLWNPADGSLGALTHSSRDHYNPKCVGRMITFTSPSRDLSDQVLWSLRPATGEESVIRTAPEATEEPVSQTRNCAQFAKLGELEACGTGETLVLSRSGKQIGRFQIQVNACPIDNHGTISDPLSRLDRRWQMAPDRGGGSE